MVNESDHPMDHNPDLASQNAAESQGQDETAEDDMSWLTFASPENPLSDTGLKITVGRPQATPEIAAMQRPFDWPRSPCIVPLCGAPCALSGTWCEQTDARELLGPPIHIGGICHDSRSSEPEQYLPFADIRNASDLPPRLMLGAELTEFRSTPDGWQARWSTSGAGWSEIRYESGRTLWEERWYERDFGPVELNAASFEELMSDIAPHYPGACAAYPLGNDCPNMLTIAVSERDPGYALWPDGYIVHFVIPVPIGRACDEVKALDLAGSLGEMGDDMIAQFWMEPATS
ncbi:MAG: hypothetical protein MK100_09555, partial [Phycisphaerales bacterium]|nr:hypothetical protein [Phycisphaerales bacterium]